MEKDEHYNEALDYHRNNTPGKISISPTKNLTTQKDLSLAYSPGVAAPCKEIAKNVDKIYDYTSRANMVAVISNGTAVLGLGNLGAAASLPVMEGKSVLFKRFAGIDSFPIVITTQNVEEFITVVKNLEYSFGGINLEDIKGPECFEIESRLKELMDIPVFHDDQHGTAIIVSAGLINSCEITNKKLSEIKVVISGAGAAGIACLDLLLKIGASRQNIILCDATGVIYKGRAESMNEIKAKYASETNLRTLKDALVGADVFIGLSVANCVSEDMIKPMAENPIIFALANPVPEIGREAVLRVRSDAIFATGRSDYPNQINNVMGFPYIFRGALDVRAKKINDEMKIAAAIAIANIAKEEVPESVKKVYSDRELKYGKDYIIPTPFDPRLIKRIPLLVAKEAIRTGVSRIDLDEDKYVKFLNNLECTLI